MRSDAPRRSAAAEVASAWVRSQRGSLAATAAVLTDMDLLLAILYAVDHVPSVLAARRVAKAWRNASGRPLLVARIQADDYLCALNRCMEVLAEGVVRALGQEEPRLGSFLDGCSLTPQERAGAGWLTCLWANGDLCPVLAGNGSRLNKRKQVIAAFMYLASEMVFRHKLHVIVGLPSSLRQWQLELQQEKPRDTFHVIVFEEGESTAEHIAACVAQRPTVLLVSPDRSRDSAAWRPYLERRGTNVVLDMGARLCSTLFHSASPELDSLKKGSSPNGFNNGWLLVLTDQQPPTGFQALCTLLSSLHPILRGLADRHGHYLALVDRYSFGDPALSQWAIDEVVAPLLYRMLKRVFLHHQG